MIAIIDYNMGNLFSVYNGMKKVCENVKLISKSEIELMEKAKGVVIPGVGAFDDGMRNLKPFVEKLNKLKKKHIPILGICLGMQILFEKSEEGKENGLGWIEGEVIKLPTTVRVPHMGWNNLKLKRNSKLVEGIGNDFFYFAHSYFCVPKNEENIIASVEYGEEIPVIVNSDSIYGVQFHPEKSSTKGIEVLGNFVRMCKC